MISPCEITYNVQASVTQTVREIIDLYLIQVFHCQKVPIKNVNLTVVVGNVTQTIATDVKQEKYSLIIS